MDGKAGMQDAAGIEDGARTTIVEFGEGQASGSSLVPGSARPRGVYTENTLKRQFSEAYLRAMAAVLNVKCVIFPSGDDIDSVDAEFDTGRFGPKGISYGINRKLEVQLKCTTGNQLRAMPNPATAVPCHRFYLHVSDYNRLSIPQSGRTYPHVLVVVRVPPAPSDWMRCHGPLTVLRAKAWWLDLTGAPPPSRTTNEPVYLPRAQIFDVSALDALMQEPW